MTTLYLRKSNASKSSSEKTGRERRQFRRHDLAQQGIAIDRWDGKRRSAKNLGQIVDLSAGGVRVRVSGGTESLRADNQIRVRLELPEYAGISPFIQSDGKSAEPKREWIGWMAISRVSEIEEGQLDVAGRLVDMDEMDRGMLGLYLSTQPLAA